MITEKTQTQQENLIHNRTLIRKWLIIIIFLLFCLIILGGLTRLTDSGLSITEWKPIHGIIPPLTDSEWHEEFQKYKMIPEYTQVNQGMDLAGFKYIFWWEWFHRAFARFIGLVFILPFLFFFFSRKLECRIGIKLFIILLLGGCQALLGWWMVKSGLTERIDVSHYRLAVHLSIAALIFVALFSLWHELGSKNQKEKLVIPSQNFAFCLVCLILLQIYSGGLMAGLHAGLSYNHWPLMDSKIIPNDLFALSPFWINFFENTLTIQFNHRILAYMIVLGSLWQMIKMHRLYPKTQYAYTALILFLITLMQAIIGIFTLIFSLPFYLALLHHVMAFAAVGAAALHWRTLKGSYRFS